MYEVMLKLEVDPAANFLEVDNNFNSMVIKELILNSVYDIDDIEIVKCEVSKDVD
tara:strand:+ start:5705 stop:5869 length:165 start_codon:yes stop_codon:yes gene_type:complete